LATISPTVRIGNVRVGTLSLIGNMPGSYRIVCAVSARPAARDVT
jgi:hypothetical protein